VTSADTALRLVRRAGKALGGTRMTRRSLLGRTAILGSAMAINPVDFAVRPASAYDAVCGGAASCSEGYSVFCCTINNGGNFCPDGTFLGGWWKADNSGFCCGGPRYYLDCNAICGTEYSCHCGDDPGTCDHRRSNCADFRYGQCHLEIDCYGPVTCRLVTCTPPWAFDPSCTTTSATDNDTASHTAPCLAGDCPSPLVVRYYDLGGPGGFLGAQVGSERNIQDGSWLELANGGLFSLPASGIHYLHGPLWSHVEQRGGPDRFGVPVQDDAITADGTGLWNQLLKHRHGQPWITAVYWNPVVGAGSVSGSIRDWWIASGDESGPLGYPTSDVVPTKDGAGKFARFAKVAGGAVVHRGVVISTPFAATHGIYGPIFEEWRSSGREVGPLGYPTSDVTATPGGVGHTATFRTHPTSGPAIDSAIVATKATGAWTVTGPLLAAWRAAGGAAGPLGFPTSEAGPSLDEAATIQSFSTVAGGSRRHPGFLVDHPTLGRWPVAASIAATWQDLGREAGALGYPLGERTSGVSGATRYRTQEFERGAVFTSSVGRGAALWGPLLEAYRDAGGPDGSLGLPLATQTIAGSVASADFQGGPLSAPA
jgi:uncharacterized protein with LGFP repeats